LSTFLASLKRKLSLIEITFVTYAMNEQETLLDMQGWMGAFAC